MVKKKLRTKKAKVRAAKRKGDDIKFELYLDSTYNVDRKTLYNFGRSMGASKRKARSYSKKLRPKK